MLRVEGRLELRDRRGSTTVVARGNRIEVIVPGFWAALRYWRLFRRTPDPVLAALHARAGLSIDVRWRHRRVASLTSSGPGGRAPGRPRPRLHPVGLCLAALAAAVRGPPGRSSAHPRAASGGP